MRIDLLVRGRSFICMLPYAIFFISGPIVFSTFANLMEVVRSVEKQLNIERKALAIHVMFGVYHSDNNKFNKSSLKFVLHHFS